MNNNDILRTSIITHIKTLKLYDLKTSSTMDKLIDDFVTKYDSDTWCRGQFKFQIELLVKEAIGLFEAEK